MTLTVNPTALRAYAEQLHDTANAAQAARTYSNRYGDMPWYREGLINRAIQAHADFVHSLTATLSHLRAVLDESAESLTTAARLYDHTDVATASTLDAALPTVDRPMTTPS